MESRGGEGRRGAQGGARFPQSGCRSVSGGGIQFRFSSACHRNLAARFHAGVATGVPYGNYRIEARLTAYSSDAKSVRVYQQHVTVILGLTVSQELPEIPPNLPGRIVGLLRTTKSFVRLIGVYANVSIDSSIEPDGRFDLGGLSAGKYLLMVVGEGGILASRQLIIPYAGPPLEIQLSGDQ